MNLPHESSKLQGQIHVKRYFYQAPGTGNSSRFLRYTLTFYWSFSPVCPETDSITLDRYSNGTPAPMFSYVGEHVRLLHQVLLFLERWHNSNFIIFLIIMASLTHCTFLYSAEKGKKFFSSTCQVLITKGK